jgi:hypothetical protein
MVKFPLMPHCRIGNGHAVQVVGRDSDGHDLEASSRNPEEDPDHQLARKLQGGQSRFMRYLHNPTDISQNSVVRHLKVSYDKTYVWLIISVKIVSYDTICSIV